MTRYLGTRSCTGCLSAQEALSKASSINLPRPEDQLIITHDGSTVGIGSILFLNRKNTLKIGAFFSAKLKDHLSRWYPCEIEALSIASSIRLFGQYELPAGSAMSSTSTFHPHKLSINLLRYYVDGGPVGRVECNK